MNNADYELLDLIDQWEQYQPQPAANDTRKEVVTMDDFMKATRADAKYTTRYEFMANRDTAITDEASEKRWKKAMSDLDHILEERQAAYLVAMHKMKIDVSIPEKPDLCTIFVPLQDLHLLDKDGAVEFFMDCCVAANHIFTPAEIKQSADMPTWGFFWGRGLDYSTLLKRAQLFVDEAFEALLENTDQEYLARIAAADVDEYEAFNRRKQKKVEEARMAERAAMQAYWESVRQQKAAEERKRAEEERLRQMEAERQRQLQMEQQRKIEAGRQERIAAERRRQAELEQQRLTAEAEQRRQTAQPTCPPPQHNPEQSRHDNFVNELFGLVETATQKVAKNLRRLTNFFS